LNYPLHRFEALAKLTPAEVDVLRRLGGGLVTRRRGEIFQREGEVTTGIHLLLEGWVTSSVGLASGRRLIQKVHLPGDMLAAPSMVIGRAVDTLTAVTHAVTSFVPYTRMGELLASQPRLTSLLFIAAQMERLSLIDTLAATGAATARENLARFLVDIHARLTPIGAVVNDSFDLPLTQDVIGDLLGLTPVHVNRTVRNMQREGLIARDRRRITLLNLRALRSLSPVPPRMPEFEPDWLPPRSHRAMDGQASGAEPDALERL